MKKPSLLREILLVAVYNTAIALFLTALTSFNLGVNLVYSNCIGFSVYGFVRGSCLLWGQQKPGWINGMLGIPLGFAVGFVLGTWLNGLSLIEVMQRHPQGVLVAGAAALLFGTIGTWHFHDEAKLLEARAEARAERARRAEQEALASRADLARLQAQIEPHFLFNTLSNVISLIDADPATARGMLLDLAALLRTSLARTRQGEVTLAEELDLLRAYLGIMGARMGDRLAWQIEAADELLGARLPPLLVQPLVENAIRHGIEPKTAGGRIGVSCRRDGDALVIAVADSGQGCDDAVAQGIGLANVRERLAACYGEAASLALETNAAGGVTARLRLPLEAA
ncbi:MAG: histidine kinase [Rhodocyclaceae bacterium]|nr:histidine kinase [Rhodocyclaceae bacterium]